MKKFSLGCEYDHEFEGWFADADAIRDQLNALGVVVKDTADGPVWDLQ